MHVASGYLGQNLSLLHYFYLQDIRAWPSKAFDTLICLQDYADFIVCLKTFCIMHISHTLYLIALSHYLQRSFHFIQHNNSRSN